MNSEDKAGKPKQLILMVDDNQDLLDVMVRAFREKGFQTLVANDGLAGLELFRQHFPDLVILDIMMPGMNGLEVCRELRNVSDVPIIMLTVIGQEVDIVRGLQAGADDYVVKPFSVRELVGRVRALLRRTRIAHKKANVSGDTVGGWHLVYGSNQVVLNGQSVKLTPTEFRLLIALAKKVGRVVSHRELLSEVWGEECGAKARPLKVYIHYLRQKLEEDPGNPCHILTERGVGYRLVI